MVLLFFLMSAGNALMATDPDPRRDDTSRGVKSYDAPERRGPGAGRLIGLLVAVIVVVLLLIWIF